MPRSKTRPIYLNPSDQPIVEQKFAYAWFDGFMISLYESWGLTHPLSEWIPYASSELVKKVDITIESANLLVEAWLIYHIKHKVD